MHGDVVDHLHDNDRLADACAAEEANLAALRIRLEEVDDLDTGLKEFDLCVLLYQGRRGAVDRVCHRCLDLTLIIDGSADNVEHPAEDLLAYRDLDLGPFISGILTAHETIRRIHCDAPDSIVANMLGNLKDKVFLSIVYRGVRNIDRTINRRKLIRWKPEVYDRSNDLYYLPFDFHAAHLSSSLDYWPRNASAPPTMSSISLVMPS